MGPGGAGLPGGAAVTLLAAFGDDREKGSRALTQVRKRLIRAPSRSISPEHASGLGNGNKEAIPGLLPCRHLCYDLPTGFEDSSKELNN